VYAEFTDYWLINLILNISWLPIFSQATPVAYGFSLAIIIGLTYTNYQLFFIAQYFRKRMNIFEIFFIRVPFTLYAAWTTTATIVIKIKQFIIIMILDNLLVFNKA
jgi:hypothetical protein